MRLFKRPLSSHDKLTAMITGVVIVVALLGLGVIGYVWRLMP